MMDIIPKNPITGTITRIGMPLDPVELFGCNDECFNDLIVGKRELTSAEVDVYHPVKKMGRKK